MKSFQARLHWLAPLWLILFFVVPLFYVLILSFLSKGTYGGIQWDLSFRAFEKTLQFQYMEIFGRTVLMAFITAISSTIIGAFCAWFIVTRSKKNQPIFLFLFLLPFLMSSLIRLYALQNFVGVSGPLQGFIRLFEQNFQSLTWSHNLGLMYVGLILTYLPFSILPLTAAFEKWEPQYLEAAEDLGSGFWRNLYHVILPFAKTGLLTSFGIVFIPCLGEYLAPEILGGSQRIYWGQLIAEAYLKWRDWPLGSVLGLVLIVTILAFFTWPRSKRSSA